MLDDPFVTAFRLGLRSDGAAVPGSMIAMRRSRSARSSRVAGVWSSLASEAIRARFARSAVSRSDVR